ncbi:hypothetical protein KEJ32_06110, partial [Candidatus Bathyarchaeota archaeon]|nr:hypothetical protein [Candidatus Bathyarchaeota archaeon]
YALISQHDIAVTNVQPLKTVVGQGYTMNINVTVANQGDFTETFDVKIYANETQIATAQCTLTSGTSKTVTIVSNPVNVQYGYYIIRAEAGPVTGETDTADNTFVDGRVKVGVPGDANNDRKVDMTDVGIILRAFGTTPASPNWNPNYDINNDNKVDMSDVGIALRNFGKTE